MSTGKRIFLKDALGRQIGVQSTFTFGRSTPDYTDITSSVSRIHFEIEPLSVDDYRSQHGLHCAVLTVKGHVVRVASSDSAAADGTDKETEYSKDARNILLKHNDVLHLVPKKNKTQFSLTVIDPKHKNNNKNKRKATTTTATMNTFSLCDSYAAFSSSSPAKRARLRSHDDALQVDSMAFDYSRMNNKNNSNNNQNGVASVYSLYQHNTPPPTTRSKQSAPAVSSLSFSLSDSAPNAEDDVIDVTGESGQYAQFPPNAVAAAAQHADNVVIFDEEKNIIDNDVDAQMTMQVDEPKNNCNDKKEEDDVEDDEDGEEEEDGRFSVALPVIDALRYRFDESRVLSVVANAVHQFMSTHRHLSLRIVLLLPTTAASASAMQSKLYHALLSAYQINSQLSIAYGHDNDDMYRAFEGDDRVLLYGGDWRDIVRLAEVDVALACRYVVNWTFWNFSGSKGDALNRWLHATHTQLSAQCIARHRTAAKMGRVYGVDVRTNDDSKRKRHILNIRPPSLNPHGQDFVGDHDEQAYRQLNACYAEILNAFYAHTKLVATDVDMVDQPQNAAPQHKNKNPLTLSLSEHEALATKKKTLHFSMRAVPNYDMPTFETWPQPNWRNALAVYLEPPSQRDPKWQPCVFYEDDEFVVIYDRFCKARYHLLVMPRCALRSVYELDPQNAPHIAMLEGMIARAKWIKLGLLRRDKTIDRITYGFHAIPSMNQLHLHIISDDLHSLHLKHKKHFHSFTSAYFIPGKVMLRCLKVQHRKFQPLKSHYEALLKASLDCHKCGASIRTIPALKRHIQDCKFGPRKRARYRHQQLQPNNNNDDEDNGGVLFSDEEEKDFEIMFEESNDSPSNSAAAPSLTFDAFVHE